MIPEQLRNWRFILIVPNKKIPIAEMKGWSANREEKTFTYDNPVLLAHITNGGNYGVVTGPDRFVVAADTKEVEKAIEERLPKTLTQKSPRHKVKHFFFYGTLTKPIECKPTAQGDPCADVKFGNAYVLGPGSKFEDYGEYIISDDVPIATITEDQLSAALDEFIKVRKKPKLSKEMTVLFTKNPTLNFPITKIIPNIDALMQTGNSLIGPHPTHGSTTGSNFHVETEKNVWKCFRTGHGGGGPLELLAVLMGIIECEDAGKGSLRGDKFKQTIAKAQELGLIPKEFVLNEEGVSKFWYLKANGTVQINIDVILNELNGLFTFKTPTDLEDIYYYDNGVYRYAEHMIKGLVETWLGEHGTTYIINEVLGHLRRKSYCDRTEFNKPQGLIPVQNGLLDLNTGTPGPFDKDKIFTYKLNVIYDADKKCPKFLKAINEWVEKPNIPILQEITGYCLLPAMPFHKLFFLHGTGFNGKGSYIATLTALLGRKNCGNLGLEEFDGSHRFSTALLYGKMINVSSEPSTERQLQTPLLKKLCGEDEIDAEVKNKQNRVHFMNIAKQFVLGNRYPRVNDNTIAFWERAEFIQFPFNFIGDKQTQCIWKTWTKDADEMSGILNWAIEGLHRLNKNNQFTKSKSTEETKLDFQKASDTTLAFLNEACIIDKESVNIKADFYDQYKSYCEESGLEIESLGMFAAKLKQQPYVRSVRRHIEKKLEWLWVGVRLITNEEKEAKNKQKTLDTVPPVPPVPPISILESLKEKESIEKSKETGGTVGMGGTPVRVDGKLEEALGHKPTSDTKEECALCLKPLWSTDTTFYQGKLAHCVCVARLKGEQP